MSVFRYGDKSAGIDFIQSLLKKLGYYQGKIDGIFGEQTKEAVQRFQKEFGIPVDGVVGKQTYDKLFPYANGYSLYRVEPNETFYTIAQKFNTDPNLLIAANPTITPTNIPIGKIIVVPFGSIVPTDIRYGSTVLQTNVYALKAVYPFIEIDSIGKSVLGVEIPYIKIGRGVKRVLYVGAIHGSDWITSMLLMKFTEDYCRSMVTKTSIYGYSPLEVFNNVTIYLVPMLNPDGVDISTQYIAQGNEIYEGIKDIAKRNPNIPFPTGWKANIRGVDLDLQFPANWEQAKKINYAKGFSAPTSSNFPGYAALTEPEALALYNFVLANNFSRVISYHTAGEVVYWKYNNTVPEGAEYIANTFAKVSGYTLADTPLEYSYGSFKDWFIQDFNRPGFIIKPGIGEPPLALTQFNKIYSENMGILVYGALL